MTNLTKFIRITRKNVNEYEGDILNLKAQFSKMMDSFSFSPNISTDSFTKKDIIKWLETATLYLMLIKSKSVGFALVKKSKIKNAMMLSILVIDKKYRNQGLGKLLIQNTINEYKKTHPKTTIAILNVNNSNDNAIHLYKKLGFSVFSVAMRKKI